MYDEYTNSIGYMNYPYTAYSRSVYNNYINRVNTPTIQVPNEILDLIRESVESEKEDELFYIHLIAIAPSEEDKKIIESIRNDERHHNTIFRKIYQELTGITLPKAVIDGVEPELNITYMQGLEKALMGELAAVVKYRKILAEMSDKKRYNMVMEVMTDELRHASKYNFLIAKNLFEMSKKEI